METDVSAPSDPHAPFGDLPAFDPAPPGERYFRHPGDVVRLVLWGTAALLVGDRHRDRHAHDRRRDRRPRSGRRRARRCRSASCSSALTQVVAIAVPAAVAIGLVVTQRWRRLGLRRAGRGAGLGAVARCSTPRSICPAGSPTRSRAARGSRRPASPRSRTSPAAAAVAMVGKPWLGRQWRRATDIALLVLALVMAVAGSAGVPALLLAATAGAAVGRRAARRLRRTEPPAGAGHGCRGADAKPASPCRGLSSSGPKAVARSCTSPTRPAVARVFVKVFGRDSRDADLLYRGYRTLLLRGPNDSWPSPSLKLDVEHEALAAAARPAGRGRRARGSKLLDVARRRIDGARARVRRRSRGSTSWRPSRSTIASSTRPGTRSRRCTAVRMAHRALRAANVLVGADGPVIIDLGFGEESATPRMQAIDRAELLASLAALVGADRAVASAVACVGPAALAAAVPYLQPLALSAATRKQVSKSLLHDLRAAVATASGEEARAARAADPRAAPHALHDRRARRRVLRLAARNSPTSATASRRSRHANWAWLVVCIVMSLLTYVASAIGMAGGVTEHLPFVPNLEAADGVVVREPCVSGQRRRDGAQRALPAEGRGPDRRSGDGRRAQLRSSARSSTSLLLVAVLRVGRPGRRSGVLDPRRQQGARRHRGRARASSGSSSPPVAAAASCARTCSAFVKQSWHEHRRCSRARP